MNGIKSLKNEARTRVFLRVTLGLFLVAPYLLWLMRIRVWSWPAVEEWRPVVVASTEQATLSAVLAMFFGFVLFSGAQAWTSPRLKKGVDVVLLFPNVVPALFLVLGLLSWITPWAPFPFGLKAVVAAHVLINSGLVAIALERLVESKLGGMAETAWTLGATRARFWRQIGLPFLAADLACIFLFVFSLCFTSFSVPLVLGGEKAATLEVAIYNLIRMDGRWDKAVILAIGQSAMLLLFALSLPRPFWPTRPARRRMDFLAVKSWRLFVLVPALIIVVGWLFGLSEALKAPVDFPPLADALLCSMALGLSVGLLHLGLFLLVAYVTPHAGLDRFLNGYLAPSPAITGFALLLLPGEGEVFDFIKLAVALTLISFPLLYRWMVHSALSAVRDRTLVARSLGARWRLIVDEVVWPQVATPVMRACGLAALWACADFAVSGIVAGPLRTLPLVMEDLMGNYRFETAQLVMFPLLLAGLGLYALFVGAAKYVAR